MLEIRNRANPQCINASRHPTQRMSELGAYFLPRTAGDFFSLSIFGLMTTLQ